MTSMTVQTQNSLNVKSMGGRLDQHFTGYQNLLDKIDDIRRLTIGEKDIRTPQVVVCGDQSMGKSSTLETISGVDLPRGEGTKTRVPLELQLRRAKSKEDECISIKADFKNIHNGEKIDIESINNQKIKESEISNKIEYFTSLLAGSGKNITDKPITLTIKRCDLVDLTLIDLPGIVRNSKDKHLPKTIKKMIERYMSNEETIILNVVSSMTDPETAESVKMSKDYDPKCERTLLVFTFVDRVELDTSIVKKYETCQNLDFNPSNIFFVRNRTTKENESNVTLYDVQQSEIDFFNEKIKNKRYNGVIPKESLGSNELTKVLVKLQKDKILLILPDIKQKLKKRIKELTNEIEQSPEIIETPNEANAKLFEVIGKLFDSLIYARDGLSMTNQIDFENDSETEEESTNQSKTNQQFICAETLAMFEDFQNQIRLIKKPKDFIDTDFLLKLRKLDKQSRGFPGLPGTTHPSIALKVIGELVSQTKEPAKDLIDDVCVYVLTHVTYYINKFAKDWPGLHAYLSEIMRKKMEEFTIQCKNDVLNMIRRERKPFSLNPRYEDSIAEIEQILQSSSKKKSYSDDSDSGIDVNNEKKQESEKISIQKAIQHPSEIEVNIYNNQIDQNACGVYKLVLPNDSPFPLYQKFTSTKIYEIKLEGKDNTAWVLVETDNSVNANDDETEIARQRSSNFVGHPIFVNEWSIKDLRIDTLDLIPLLKSSEYEKMESNAKKMFNEAIKMSCYWKVVCDRLCDMIPICIRDYLIDNVCDSRNKVQMEIMQIKNDTIKTNEDWIMHLMKLDLSKENRRKYCEKKLKDLKMAQTKANEIEYYSQTM